MAKHKIRKGKKMEKSQVKTLFVSTVLPVIIGQGIGAGGVDYPCAGCGAVLGDNLSDDAIHGVGFECPTCHTVTYWD